MSGKVVTSALVASALGVGVVVGLAAPRSQHLDDVSTVPNAQDAQLVANLVTKGEWVATINGN